MIRAWYRNDSAPVPETSNFWLHAVDPKRGAAGRLDGGVKLGAVGRWRSGGGTGGMGTWQQARGYFFSGARKSVDFEVRFFGDGLCALGPCELRPLRGDGFSGPFLIDADFEKGAPGRQPVDYAVSEATPVSIATDGGYSSGKKSLKIVIERGKPMSVRCAQHIPAYKGDTVHLTFSARASAPGLKLRASLHDPLGWKESVDTDLSEKWQRVTLKGTVPVAVESRAFSSLALIDFSFESPAGPGATVWLDDFAVNVASMRAGEYGVTMPGRNLVMNPSFEGGLTGWSYRFSKYILSDGPDMPVGTAEIDPTTAAEGTCSMKITIPELPSSAPAESGKRLWCQLGSIYFTGRPWERFTVSFWAKADRASYVRAYLTPRFAIFGGVIRIDKEWKRYDLEVTPRQMQNRLKGFLALRMDFAPPGAYWIDGVQVERGALSDFEPPPKLEIGAVCTRLYPSYQKGETPEADVYVCSRLAKASRLRFGYEILDWRRRVVDRHSETVSVGARETRILRRQLPAQSYGPFIVRLRLSDPTSGETASAPLIYGVFPKPRTIDPENSFFGWDEDAMTMYGQTILKGGSMADYYALMRLTGAKWKRSFQLGNWSLHEKEQGQWRWADRYVDAIRRNGIKILPVLGYRVGGDVRASIPKWANSDRTVGGKPGVPEGKVFYPKLELWENFVGRLVRRYGDRIDTFEMLNETGWFDAKEYVEYTKATYRLLKSIDARHRLVGPGYPCQRIPYGPNDNTWIGQVLKLGLYDLIDVYSGHFYAPGTGAASLGFGAELLETASDQGGLLEESHIKRMKYLREAYGDKAVWDTESGQASAPQLKWMFNPFYIGIEELCPAKVGAERFARWTVMKMAMGIGKIFYHHFRAGYLAHSFTVAPWECNYAPRPLAVAYAQLARRLDGFRFIDKTTLGSPTTRAYLFEVDGKPVVVYWDYAAEQTREMVLALPRRQVLVEDLMGNEIAGERRQPETRVPLDQSPVYVVGKGIKGGKLLDTFRKAQVLGGTPAELAVALGSGDGKPSLVVGVRNLGTATLRGKLTVTEAPKGWRLARTVPFSGLERDSTAYLPIPLESYASDTIGEPVVASTTISGEALSGKRAVTLARAARRRNPVTIDGRIADAEYGGAAAIHVGNESQLAFRQKNGPPSAQARVRCLWDEAAVYVGVEVTDDHLQTKAGKSDLYMGDCLEVYVDTDTKIGMFDNKYFPNIGRFTCAPVQPGKEPARFEMFPDPPGAIKGISMKEVEIASQKMAQGWTIELRIPAASKNLSLGGVWGFNVSLIDADNDGRCQWFWNGKTGKHAWKHPHDFGYLVLTD